MINLKSYFIYIGLLLFIITNTLYSCGERDEATNSVLFLSDSNPEIPILQWRIIGPFTDSIRYDDLFNKKEINSKTKQQLTVFENLSISQGILDTAADGTVRYKKPIDTLITQKLGYFTDLEKILSTPKKAFAYATCNIISKGDTEVAFLMAADDNLKVWVNGKLYIQNDTISYLEKNKIVEKIPLKDGLNQVLLEIANVKEERWNFNLNISTIKHVRENALIENYYRSCESFVVAMGDSLQLKVSNVNFIPIEKNSTINIYDAGRDLVMQKVTNIKSDPKISLEGLQEGAYSFKLYTDIDTLDGVFTYGDINNIYSANNLNEKVPFDEELFNTHSFVSKRVEYLLDYAKRKGIDWKLSKKIAICLYRLAEINHRYRSGESIYGTGLQMRTFKSSIDNSDEYYQIYIPENYNRKLPLVVMVPYVTTVRPFYRGAVVANTERVEYLGKFAEQFGFAVLWPSSKIYKRYNLTPIVSETLNEVLDDVAKYYAIDQEKLYLYGDCSGALQALLMATRHPDKFAAIGIEGTELASVNFGQDQNYMPSPILSNNIFNLTDNLSNIPVFVLHSKNDEKAPLELVNTFIDSIKVNGGDVVYDNLGDAYKADIGRNVKLFSEPEIMYRIFKFFNKKKRSLPLKGFSYSTYGYYQDSVYEINILEKIEIGEKATVRMQPLKGNTLKFNTVNVKRLSFNLDQLKGINKNQKINVFFNDRLYLANKLSNVRMPLQINIVLANHKLAIKDLNKKVNYGPINKLFLKKFAVVKPLESDDFTNKAIQQLSTIWKTEYMTDIPVIDEPFVPSAIKEGMNLIFIADTLQGNGNYVNFDLPKIEHNGSSINFNGKKISGKELSFAIISKLPKTNNHILYLGSNFQSISENMLNEIIQQGWNDFEIWDPEKAIYHGNYQ